MNRRPFRALAGVAVGLAALLVMTATPAEAEMTGGGAVSGTVTVTPGVTLTPQATSYSFSPIVIVGSINGCTGTITTTSAVTGSSTAESVVSANATVNGFTFSGSGAGGCTIDGTASGGTVLRLAAHAYVSISASVTVCGPVVGCKTVSVTIIITAGFVATAGDGVTTPITQAAFAGAAIVSPVTV